MKNRSQTIPFFLLLAGFVMIFLGVHRGEHQTVLEKAIRICLECMGIG